MRSTLATIYTQYCGKAYIEEYAMQWLKKKKISVSKNNKT